MKTKELRETVLEIMRRENLSRAGMASLAHVSQATVSRWIEGKHIPDAPKIVHLRELLREARQNHPDSDHKPVSVATT